MKKIFVFYEGWGERWHLGTLGDNGSQLLFEYSPEAIKQGLELSPHQLKLRPQAYSDFPAHQLHLPGFIADCLPDGWGMVLMDRVFRSLGRDAATLSPLDRLAFIGNRSIGALTFEPAEAQELSARDLDLLVVAQDTERVLTDQSTTALRQLAVMGGSPQGARPKVLVHYDATSGVVSTQHKPGTQPWLVKFQAQGETKMVCAIEQAYAEYARACGLDVPDTRYFELDKQRAAFGIARFDVENGMRVPVHTLAGALHADFRNPGTVDYTTFLRATRFFTQSEAEVKKAYERAVFNVLFNNRDDHPKNFSFRLNRQRRWELAPCYDLTFSEGPRGEHYLDVCGEGRNITRDHLLKLAQQGGLDPKWAGRTIDRMLEVSLGIGQLAAGHDPIFLPAVARIEQAVDANRKRLAA